MTGFDFVAGLKAVGALTFALWAVMMLWLWFDASVRLMDKKRRFYGIAVFVGGIFLMVFLLGGISGELVK